VTQLLTTRLTDLFGIRLPVLAGGLQWLANADYVAAAVDAGIMGFITAASFSDNEGLRAEIRRCRELTGGKPFGVNVSMLPKLAEGERTDGFFDVIIDEGVPFVETSGRNPEAYIPRLHAAGVKVIHKVPAVRFAKKAEAVGVDAVTVVGAECGGHPGMDLIGTFVQGALAAQSLSIPLVIAGGVGTGAHLVAALALGADGVLIGTRFLVADEIPAHADYKRHLVRADERETELILKSVRNTARVLRNETTAIVMELEAKGGGDIETLMPYVSGQIGRQAYLSGDPTRGALSVGQSVVFADRLEPLARIVARIEEEAIEALDRLDRARGKAVRWTERNSPSQPSALMESD
jgi:nitronate monooxygenase